MVKTILIIWGVSLLVLLVFNYLYWTRFPDMDDPKNMNLKEEK